MQHHRRYAIGAAGGFEVPLAGPSIGAALAVLLAAALQPTVEGVPGEAADG